MAKVAIIINVALWYTVTQTLSLETPNDLLVLAKRALASEKVKSHLPCQNDTYPDVCPPSKFRQFDGDCNNVIHHNWGARGDIFPRLFAPSYADGLREPRSSHGTHALPDAESIIVNLESHIQSGLRHPHITAMLPAWGQLLAADLYEFSQLNSDTNCCKQKNNFKNTECYVARSNCKDYKRTAPGYEMESCGLYVRQQMNVASAYIDGSGLYGTTVDDVENLRTFKKGAVKADSCRNCQIHGATGALHRALLQEHNNIAAKLSQLNAMWSDEDVFLETRRIVTAQIQHITYNEFLPLVLGEETTAKEGLRLIAEKHAATYSSTQRGGIFAEVATSAMPAFLTLYPPEMISSSMSSSELLSVAALQKSFLPSKTNADGWPELALAIHRGRDHGVPPYHHVLELCPKTLTDKATMTTTTTSTTPITFESLSAISNIPEEDIANLRDIYQSAPDIDLFVGAILEKPAVGALFGPTITCLLTQQFAHLKKSDRFWYENDIPPSSLALEQLQSIRKTTLSGLLCASNQVLKAQPKAFIREDEFLNSVLSCDQIDKLDINAWIVNATDEFNPDEDQLHPAVKEMMKDLSEEMMKEAVERAKEEFMYRSNMEYQAYLLHGGGISAKSPDGSAASFSKANRHALLLANSSRMFELTSNEILNAMYSIRRRKRQTFDNNNLNLFNRNDLTETLQTIDITPFIADAVTSNGGRQRLEIDDCDEPMPPCNSSSPFRSYTGYCNNLRNPNWGKSLTVFSRLLPAEYEDGISKPRIQSVRKGILLPNPRTISTTIHPDISNLHSRYSLLLMQYAQFLDHDLTLTPIHKGFHESIPSCRPCNSPYTVHRECNPFPVPKGDPAFPEINQTTGERLCFPSMRSLPGQQTLGPRDQVNQNTHLLDASVIYGENQCVASRLRGFAGRLNSTILPFLGKELLPQSNSHPECKSRDGLCFIAGDERASEQPGLTSIHTIFLREHNRIVEALRGVNPHWTGEQLYQHGRRIMSARLQHITYNEFLPRILSWNAVNLYGLRLLDQGYYREYNSECSPVIFNEFAAAAFRIGHSLLRPHIPRLSIYHQPVDPPILLRDGFFRMDILLQPGIIDEIMRGLVATPMETLDQFITGEVTNHLFEDRAINHSGIDLIALNIQRARDHGVPSYNKYRSLCNLQVARRWSDLKREIPMEVIERFQKIYASVDDIDLFPGAMTERALQGGLVGPTLACIIGIQFRQLRKCDRFWYENSNPEVKFTEGQLAAIRKTTLAKIICDNLENPGDMQRAAFDLPSNYLNPRVSCDSMQQLELGEWRENPFGCTIGNRHVRIGESAFPTPCTSCVCTPEGPQCASLRITNCALLIRQWAKDAILRDDVCSSQCGVYLNGNAGNVINSPRVQRSRPPGFPIPDLSAYISSF